MIEEQLQFELFRAAKKAGDAAGFELYSVVVSENTAEYTWKRFGSEVLGHQFTVSGEDFACAISPKQFIFDAFERQFRTMKHFREMREQP